VKRWTDDGLLRCIRTGEPPCSSLDDGITVLRKLHALYASAQSGRSVEI
jgi:predicted dehydrogenase